MAKKQKKIKVRLMAMILCVAFSLSGLQTTVGAEAEEALIEDGSYTGKNYLYYGYNTLEGSYVNTTNTGSKPILSKVETLQGAADPASYGSTSYIYDSSIYSFYEKFSATVNVNYKGVAFSGKAKAEFSTTMNSTENRLYIRHTAYFYTKDYSNETAIIDLNQNLAEGFEKDVRALYATKPYEIFDTYGTHLITQYYTGGRLDLNFSYKNKEKKTEQEIRESVEASYGKVSGSVHASQSKKSELIENNATLISFSTGGTTEAQITGRSIAAVAQEFKNWQSSIDKKPDICGVKQGSLYPIWDLFSDEPEIRNALKKAYEDEQERKALGLKNMDRGPITDITAFYADSYEAAQAKVPDGYYIVQAENPSDIDRPNLDANHYGRGKYIFLACTYKPVVNQQKKRLNPIVDFKVAKGKSTEFDNYHKVPLDLNMGQGGPYLYLFYRRATDAEYMNKDTLYISAIKGYYGKNYVPPANWFVNGDSVELNKGIKNRDGKDNYTNLMFQNDYRLMEADEILKDSYEEETIVAVSDYMEDIPFDESKPLIESDEDVFEYEEGFEDELPDDSETPDESDEGKADEDASEDKLPDDDSETSDESDEGKTDNEAASEDEFSDDSLLEGGLYNSEAASEDEFPDEGQSDDGLLLAVPKTGDNSSPTVIILPIMGIVLAALLIADQKKRRMK